MTVQDHIGSIFPAWEDIPAQHRLLIPVEQREHLIHGELRRVDGPVQEVFSPVCVNSPAGPRRHRIGSFPLMTEAQAVAVLDAAVSAYDNGRGAWPTHDRW